MVRLGILGDFHFVQQKMPARYDDIMGKINALNAIGTDINFVLGDNCSNLALYTISPCTMEFDTDYDLSIKQVKEVCDALASPYLYTIGNHDVFLNKHKALFGDPNKSMTVGGLRFIVFKSIFGNNDTVIPNMVHWTREENYPRVDIDTLEWLRNEILKDTTIPTFVGTHIPLTWGFPAGDVYATRSDALKTHQACQYGAWQYFNVENREIVIDVLGLGNTVACFHGHWPTTDWSPYTTTKNGIVLVLKPHGVGLPDNVLWADLDPATGTGTIYWRDIPTHTDTTIATITW